MKDDDHMSRKELAEYLQVSVSWLEHDLDDRPPFDYDLRGRARYSRAAVDAWIAARTTPPPPSRGGR